MISRWRRFTIAGVLAATVVPVPPAGAARTDLVCAAPGVGTTATSPHASVEDGRPDPSAAQATAWRAATADRLAAGPATAAGPIVVPVAWHILEAGPTFVEGHLARSTVRAAVRQVERGFKGLESEAGVRTRFRFELAKITRTRNAHYFTDLRWYGPTERKLKTELRTGGPETLNIYSARPVAGISGWASFPQEYPDAPHMDGVVIHFGSVPGGFVGGGQGDILTHEVGHWLGLFHTFQGGCTAPGDEVDDTPYEASSSRDCAQPRDTCDAPGDDPVHNYMDYAKDQCKDQFTAGQRTRMTDHWYAWRG